MAMQDPIELQIEQEVEEFLRDLTLEFSFPEIFEALRRHGFRDFFGSKVSPFPRHKFDPNRVKDIEQRFEDFLGGLRHTFGARYSEKIIETVREYTRTTLENDND